MDYDPNDVGQHSDHIFSLPHDENDAEVILLPVPWDVTVSYNDGTSKGPQTILQASSQLDLYDPLGQKIWEYGVHILPLNKDWAEQNRRLRSQAKKYILWLENGSNPDSKNEMDQILNTINEACFELKSNINSSAHKLLQDNKLVGLVGGDHSCPLGLIEVLSERHDSFGILQIDAHADLRETYENFTHSHASIFHNTLSINNIENLTQVGLRDISPNEANRIKSDKRIVSFFDWELKQRLFQGESWSLICDDIISTLPQKVYISFDIDGLSPEFCPGTGTPVPGGLSFSEAIYLLETVLRSGKQIIGFDLCEVGDSEWDGNVGARILFKLCNILYASQNQG